MQLLRACPMGGDDIGCLPYGIFEGVIEGLEECDVIHLCLCWHVSLLSSSGKLYPHDLTTWDLKIKPSGQRMRGSGSSPAILERSKIDLSLVAETKALELLALRRFGLAAKLSPVGAIKPGDVLNELLLSARILFPPVIISDTAPVAQ